MTFLWKSPVVLSRWDADPTRENGFSLKSRVTEVTPHRTIIAPKTVQLALSRIFYIIVLGAAKKR